MFENRAKNVCLATTKQKKCLVVLLVLVCLSVKKCLAQILNYLGLRAIRIKPWDFAKKLFRVGSNPRRETIKAALPNHLTYTLLDQP